MTGAVNKFGQTCQTLGVEVGCTSCCWSWLYTKKLVPNTTQALRNTHMGKTCNFALDGKKVMASVELARHSLPLLRT